jgi:hypothetical protein
MSPRSNRIFVLAPLLAAATAVAGDVPARLWPVPLEPAIASNFCEYREGRFHAGLDVRTYGREGVPCRAVEDGWVSRMRASSRGYGKALHLELASGEQMLYAHLAEFAPQLEDTLAAAQAVAGRYNVDVTLPEGRFRFHRGDVIAYSGMTGATAPHLHFETRSKEDAAVNPFLRGFAMTDRMRPVISRVAFMPLDPGASVEGARFPLELTPRSVTAGRYAIDDTLLLAGPVGVAASVYDRVNSASGKLCPYEMQVWADDSLLADLTMKDFPFVRSGEVDLLYHAGALRERGVTLFQLFARRGETIDGREFVRGGCLTPGPGSRRVHRGRVVARDVAGNHADVDFFYVDVASAPGHRARARGFGRAPDLAVDLDGAYFYDGFAVIPPPGPKRGSRERARGSDAMADTLVLRAHDLAGTVRAIARDTASDTATVYATGLEPGAGRTVAFPALGASITVGDRDLYAGAVIFATRAGTAGAAATHGLVRRTMPVRVGPAGWVLKSPMAIRIDMPHPGERDAIFRYDDRGGWAYVESTRDSSGVTAQTDRPGVFAIIEDAIGPWLGTPRAVSAASYATGKSFTRLLVPVDDTGSGLDDRRITVEISGTPHLAHWDFAKKKIVVDLRGESIIGTHPVRVSVFDRIGNESVAEASVDFDAR